ncbi:MAG: hypothetical protein ACF8MJ_06880 [Phycisphaerales bacterium JB050]
MAVLIVLPTALIVLVIWLIATTPGRIRRKRLRDAGIPLCWKCHARLDELNDREEFCPHCRSRIQRFGEQGMRTGDAA